MEITSEAKIQIRFTVKDDAGHELTDALYLTQAEIDAAGPDGIRAMQEARFTNWLAVVTAPPPVLTEEQVAIQKAEELARMQEQMVSSTGGYLSLLPAEVVPDTVVALHAQLDDFAEVLAGRP